ncbi:MAG: hypothetical protein IH831_06565 [Planctomycetes bacterium]|nr:hypothetical protein [Planctomycetota bacterium]
MLALLLCALIGVGPTPARAEELFDPPAPSAMADEILMMSTRAVGTVCDGKRLSEKLRCQRYEIGDDGCPHWKCMDWRDALQPASPVRKPASPLRKPASPVRTVVYVHGNRIEPGEDRYRGMLIYRSLVAQGRPSQPIRFIIWSWPASTIPGPIKDMRLKAARTCPVGWQLAWFIDQLPEETPVSLIGYSYGARVASGALHVLGGGRLNGLQLTERLHPQRPPIRVAMIAAAFDAGDAPITRPVYVGANGDVVPGHPVLIARRIWPDVERLEGDEGARALLAAHPDWLQAVRMDGAPAADIDTQADYQRALNAPAESATSAGKAGR